MDKNTPVAKDQTVKPGDQPNAKDSIGNVGDLPEGTTFEYKWRSLQGRAGLEAGVENIYKLLSVFFF